MGILGSLSYLSFGIKAGRTYFSFSITHIHNDVDKGLKSLQTTKQLKVAINGHFGRNHVTPRGLNCEMVNQLVCRVGPGGCVF